MIGNTAPPLLRASGPTKPNGFFFSEYNPAVLHSRKYLEHPSLRSRATLFVMESSAIETRFHLVYEG